MSWKTRDDLSDFGDRLRRLMVDKSLHEVATAFYSSGLINVTPRNKKNKKERSAFDKRDSAIGSIEKRIREHLNADGPECLQGEYVMAYCKYFNCSADYLYGYTDVRSPDVDIRKICERTGLSEQAVKHLCEEVEIQGGSSSVHQCWSRLMEGEGFLTIPFDWFAAYEEAREVYHCNAEIAAISTVLENEDPTTVEYNLIDIKKKPIDKVRQGHYAAYYGLLYKLSQDVTHELDSLAEQQIDENHIYEEALKDLIMQYQDDLHVMRKEPIPKRSPTEFRFRKHRMI